MKNKLLLLTITMVLSLGVLKMTNDFIKYTQDSVKSALRVK